MIKNILAILTLSYFTTASAAGVIGNQDTYSYVDTVTFPENFNAKTERQNFFQLDGFYDWMTEAKLHNGIATGHELRFNDGKVNFSYVAFLDCYDALSFGVGYENTLLDWKGNPFFHEDEFHTLDLTVAGMSEAWVEWTWKASLTAEIDTAHFDLSNYTRYSGTLWGRYSFCNGFVEDLGINFGVIGYTGLKKNWALPILGIDFKVGDRWECNLIFPVDMALIYDMGNRWSLVFAGRIWNLRHRVGGSEPLSKAIWEYLNSGIEVGISWDYDPIVSLNVHVGSTLGNGQLRINGRDNNNGSKFDFGGSAYCGFAASVRF